MKRRFLIYGLVDPRDQQVRYVGKSSSGLARPRGHSAPSRLKEKNHRSFWIKSLLAQGLKPLIVILEELQDDSTLNESEVFYIGYLRWLGCDLTNHTEGGEGAIGNKLSAETRAKMSAVRLGRKKTPEHCASISRALQGHSFSTETLTKMRIASTGNSNCVGRKVSPETRAKMSESVRRTHYGRGKKLSAETKAKMSTAARNRARGPDGTYLVRAK